MLLTLNQKQGGANKTFTIAIKVYLINSTKKTFGQAVITVVSKK